MRIKVNSNEIIQLSLIAEKRMKCIEKEYLDGCELLYKEASIFSKCRVSCKIPISFRFFHKGEFLSGSKDLKQLRKEWHNWWSILNQFPQLSPNVYVWLDEFETEVVLFLKNKNI